jgi:hypothetical protein
MPYEKDTLFRNERLAELRQWTKLIKRKPIQERIGMTAEGFAHWADVTFLLEEMDAVDDATITPPLGSPPVETTPFGSTPVVDPANLIETITVEALKQQGLTKKTNPVDDSKTGDISAFNFPVSTKTLAPLPAIQGLTTTAKSPLARNRPSTLGLNKVEIWNAAIAQATQAVERALSEAHTKHYDIYAIKALALKLVADCRKSGE